MVKTLAKGDKPFDVFVWSWNFGHILQILPKHLKSTNTKVVQNHQGHISSSGWHR
jgi:hypothetical protein